MCSTLFINNQFRVGTNTIYKACTQNSKNDVMFPLAELLSYPSFLEISSLFYQFEKTEEPKNTSFLPCSQSKMDPLEYFTGM